jgi:hypothetical protein
MKHRYALARLGKPIIIIFLLAPAAGLSTHVYAQTSAPGRLQLTVVDETSGQPTPARVELLDMQGHGHVARDALPIDGDCSDHLVPPSYTLERAIAIMPKQLLNPYTNTVQFYSVGNSEISLPPGDYNLN